jgi:DNA-binding NarL/FixJ family response regulator
VSRLARHRVVVVDESPRQRSLLVLMLGMHPDVDVVGEGGDGYDIVWLALSHQPDVVVCDLGLPPMDSLDALPLVRTIAPATKVLVCAPTEDGAAEALRRGADACMTRGTPTSTLVEKVREVATMLA